MVDKLTTEDVVVVAVGSEPVPGYERTREEVISAKVIEVEETIVRGRVYGPVVYAKHLGAHAGHGFRVGDLIEVPRSMILVAARPTVANGTGYGAEGPAENTFKPSSITREEYKIRPATPYDLVLPVRSEHLEWYVDGGVATVIRVGEKGLLEQVMFGEDSARGEVTLRVLNRAPQRGVVFVGRWDFELQT